MEQEKVVVAMSGGVDSSVAAFLLKAQGYDAIGATLRLCLDEGSDEQNALQITRENAKNVARSLSIPHHLLDFHQEFGEQVIEPFCREYVSGRTPNPCVVCNRTIKFGLLLAWARVRGVKYVATGHYARVAHDKSRGRFLLLRGKDPKKDQSYFLFDLSQDQLGSVIFPLGEVTKAEVREKAKALGLKAILPKESQDICFIPNNDHVTFLKQHLGEEAKSGPIVSTAGEVLGRHEGIFSFTIGQRKGLNVAKGYPLYVVALDTGSNAVVVGRKNEAWRKECTTSRTNWIAFESITKPLRVKARIRYKHPEADAQVIPLSPGTVKVEFFEPQLAITPGQAMVFYDGDVVLGGGWIE